MRLATAIVASAFMTLGAASTASAFPSPVPETGQTRCFDDAGIEIICSGTGQDGDLRKGLKWPVPRLTDNGDGTVTDNLTGLIWLKNRFCGIFFPTTWLTALTLASGLADGSCSLTDGSLPGDWRLPNIRELQSIVDFGNGAPALPTGHPFDPSTGGFYWSSTTSVMITFEAYRLNVADGGISPRGKASGFFVWPYYWGERRPEHHVQ